MDQVTFEGTVTVFGGSGFIGRHLVRRLARAGARVRVAVRDAERAAFLKPMGDVGQVVPWTTDVTDKAQVRAALEDADAAVNLIGILYESGARTFERMHVEVAESIASAAAKAGAAKLVHISALGVQPHSPALYARTKAAGEAAVKKAFPGTVILRPSVVFGPEDNFFNQFAGMARLSPVLPVIGAPAVPTGDPEVDGGPKFQPVYVGDVADAIMAALTNPSAKGKAFDLGGPEVMSFRDVMELVMEATGRRRLLLPVPFFAAEMMAAAAGLLPVPPLTGDQVLLLKSDNVVPPRAKTFKQLGIVPQAAAAIVPTYLGRFRANAIHGAQHP